MRNVRRELESMPKYTEKELQAMKEAEYAEMDRKMQQAYKKFYGRP